MSTQTNGFPAVEFSITSPFQNVRLMEVPDEVLNIITTHRSSGSKIPALKFKSSASSDSSHDSSTAKVKEGILHLCSDDRAWAIKQVSTSNSVYLIQPSNSSVSLSTSDGHEEMANIDLGSVTATSQVRNFIELHPVNINTEEIEMTLLDTLPVYDIDASEEDATETTTGIHQFLNYSQKRPYTIESLINSIARPDQILRDVCARLCVFEASEHQQQQEQITSLKRRCHIPSPLTLLKVWSSIVESCSIEMIKLDHAINEERIISALGGPDMNGNETYKTIAHAIIRPDGMFDRLGLIESTGGDVTMDVTMSVGDEDNRNKIESDTKSKVSSARYFKPQETAKYVATLILRASAYQQVLNQATLSSTITQSNANDGTLNSTSASTSTSIPKFPISTSQFIQIWSNNLPTSFTKYTTLETLQQIPIDNISVTTATTTQNLEDETEFQIEWNIKPHTNNTNANIETTNKKGREPRNLTPSTKEIADLLLSGQKRDTYQTLNGNNQNQFPTATVTSDSGGALKSSTTGTGNASNKSNTSNASSTTNTNNATNKRKWHEKFGAQRRM